MTDNRAAAGESGRRAVVCLADVADNPGGGGRGNTTDILEGLLLARVKNTLLGNFVDSAAAARCHAGGVGATQGEGDLGEPLKHVPRIL